MTDMMLLEVDSALLLQQRMATAADELDFDAQSLVAPLTEATELLGGDVSEVVPRVIRAADDLRASAHDLDSRIRMVLASGPEMNAGLAALERIRSHFLTIESRGDPSRADGVLSRRDLQWAHHQLDSETSAAAGWLIDHNEFFDQVETAKYNDEYLSHPYDGDFPYDPNDRDGLLSLDDIDAFIAKTAAWSTLLPLAGTIDTAHRGGPGDGRLSRNDFESFLSDYNLSPEISRAVRQVLDDGAYQSNDSLLNWGLVLDGVSFVPVIGDVVDGARAIHYALHGDWTAAAIYGLGLVPLPGLSGSGVTAGYKVVKSAVSTAKKSGYRTAAKDTAKVLHRGTTFNWTAHTAAEALTDSAQCSSTYEWIAQQAGVDIAKLDKKIKTTTGEDIGDIKNRLSDLTGHDLSIMDGFFNDTCEVIARRIGEHKLSKVWLP